MLPTHSGTHGININISRERKCGILMKHWTKAKLKPSRANSKRCSSLSSVKGLLWLFPSSFADCETLLSSGSTSACSCPWQVSHGSGTSDILRSPVPLTFTASRCGYSGSQCKDFPSSHLASAAFVNHRRSYTLYSYISFMTLKARTTWLMLPSSSAYLG